MSPLTTRIVGIGASAGGLAPLEAFLGNIPPHSGLAYIVVQHLDPTHETLLSELLQRVTTLPVQEVRENTRIEPDCIYVISPNTELSISDGTLQVNRPAEPRGMQLPIDVLFSSLAGALGERAIAVVLSGMGSDGTLGLQAIRAVGGLTVVQRPDTAQFDSMPRSAISAQCGDIVAPPQELPTRILNYVAQVLPDPDVSSETPALKTEPLQRIFALLRQQTRHDFSLYKPSTMHRRIERRMAIASMTELDDYADFLQENPHEIELLFNELLIGVTSFFRDPPVWEHLAKVALPSLLNRQGNKTRLRAWVIGCSTGEEAYSLAMIFSEAVSRESRYKEFSLQIFASDLSREAIDTARRGRYPGSITSAVSPERLRRFFDVHAEGYKIKNFIRDMVLFAQQDVVLDPPFTKLDLICCRNLLIYFTPDLQNRLVPMFHYSLEPGGILLLGTAETIGHYNQLFNTTESKLRFYRRQDNAHSGGVDFLIDSFPPHSKVNPEIHVKKPPPSTENLQVIADRVLLQFFAPAAVVINNDGDILYISGSTGKYLEPAMGKANWNFHAMVREGLRMPLNTALKKFRNNREPQHLQGLHVSLPGGGDQLVDITIQSLGQSGSANQACLIVFQDLKRPLSEKNGKQDSPASISAHEAEIQQYRDEIQSLREEARASKEELQSANEELQSTNEELTTSKEEMQSMNEELQTINAEMQSKLDDLSLAQSDLKNLLNSIEIAILFLDQDLNVRRYTDRVTKIINVRESDVGRPFSDLTSNLKYPELHDDALETLRTLTFSEKQIRTNDGRWFNIRIMPYRTLNNMLDGLVITFVDITTTKELEHELRQGLDS